MDHKSLQIIAMISRGCNHKSLKSRVRIFVEWLRETNGEWENPKLQSFGDYLLGKGIKASTVNSYLSTIRSRYDLLFAKGVIPPQVFLEMRTIQRYAANETNPPVTKGNLELSPRHIYALLEAPGLDTLIGLRDTALIALMVCTGIRQSEVPYIEVADLRHSTNEGLALRVKEGSYNTPRVIAYGSMMWCLEYVEKWLLMADIRHGAVFRGFYNGGRRVRDKGITERSIEKILSQYPIHVGRRKTKATSLDLRKTYARRCYDLGMPIEGISRNLGSNPQSTVDYVGNLPRSTTPPDLYQPPNLLALRLV